MVSKKDKDAENGLQVLSILGIFWTIGFFYWTNDDIFNGDNVGQASMLCCNSMNIFLTIIFLASLIYVKKENRVKDQLEEHFLSAETISVFDLVETNQISHSSASKIMAAWISQTEVNGDFDPSTGIFRKHQENIEPSKIIDADFQEFSDKPDEFLPFCPECGQKLTLIVGSQQNWCGNCKKHVQSK